MDCTVGSRGGGVRRGEEAASSFIVFLSIMMTSNTPRGPRFAYTVSVLGREGWGGVHGVGRRWGGGESLTALRQYYHFEGSKRQS